MTTFPILARGPSTIGVSRDDLAERIPPIDQRRELPGFDQVAEVPDHRLVDLREREQDPRAWQQRGDDRQGQVLVAGPWPGGHVDAAGPQQWSALAEGDLADGVEDDVVALLVVGEVAGRVVEDPAGPEAPHEVQVLGSAGSGDNGADRLEQLDGRRADGAGRAVDEHVLPGFDPGPADVGEGVVRTLGGRGSLVVEEIRWHGSDRAVGSHHEVLGVRPEPALAVTEDPVASALECGDAGAGFFDVTRELGPEDGGTRPEGSGQQSHDGGSRCPVVTVRPVHRCRANPDEQFAVADRGPRGGGDPDDGRRAVPGVDRSLHA